MAMTAASQGGVVSPASRVMLYGHACPMVHRISETVVAGLPSHHNAALGRPLGCGRDSRQTAQGGVISSLQGIEAFCQQRGEDDPSHSRQGCEDLHVMLLSLPRLGLLGRGQLGGQTQAASVVPAATSTGGLRKTPSTWAASKLRMRLRFKTLVIVISRTRPALAGVGAVSHKSSSHSAPRSVSS